MVVSSKFCAVEEKRHGVVFALWNLVFGVGHGKTSEVHCLRRFQLAVPVHGAHLRSQHEFQSAVVGAHHFQIRGHHRVANQLVVRFPAIVQPRLSSGTDVAQIHTPLRVVAGPAMGGVFVVRVVECKPSLLQHQHIFTLVRWFSEIQRVQGSTHAVAHEYWLDDQDGGPVGDGLHAANLAGDPVVAEVQIHDVTRLHFVSPLCLFQTNTIARSGRKRFGVGALFRHLHRHAVVENYVAFLVPLVACPAYVRIHRQLGLSALSVALGRGARTRRRITPFTLCTACWHCTTY